MSLPMRFLLFCNHGYGQPFQAAFRAWCARRGVTDHLVVHSLRGIVAGGPADRPLARWLSRRAGIAAASRLAFLTKQAILVDDVNSEAFARACLPAESAVQGIVAGFNQIFSAATIARFDHLYNFHPSLLPYYRGPVPSFWCIRNGETATGITLHEVGPRIDDGRILWQEEAPVTTQDADEMDRILARRGAAMMPAVLDGLLEGRPLPESRVEADRVYRQRVGYRSFPR
jgi:methionyl-tRNA formyltransferase